MPFVGGLVQGNERVVQHVEQPVVGELLCEVELLHLSADGRCHQSARVLALVATAHSIAHDKVALSGGSSVGVGKSRILLVVALSQLAERVSSVCDDVHDQSILMNEILVLPRQMVSP